MKVASGEETLDAILGGRIELIQPRRGYRFGADAVLLGRFAKPRAGNRALELGAGCGVISMLLAALHDLREMAALEVQADLVELIRRNVALNRLPKVRALCGDLRARKIAGLAPASFDLVVMNPPYRARAGGRQSPNPARRLAREELGATLGDFLSAAARYLRHGGRLAAVFAAARSAELIAGLRAHSLEPKRIRMVHPRHELPASNILIEARKGAGVEVMVEPPLVLWAEAGVYSDEARRLLLAEPGRE